MTTPETRAHLHALELRLSNERARLAAATSKDERALRTVWIAQIEREISAERAFLMPIDSAIANMSDDDLARELAE